MFGNLVHSFLDMKWKLYSKFETDLHELRYLFWETTRECNLSCLHCGSDCSADPEIKGVETEKIKSVFYEIAQRWDPRGIMLVVTGGEPLVRKDLFEVLGYASQLGYRTGMVTNGYILNKKAAIKIIQTGISSIVVSLDGPEAIHDWLRNRKGSYKRAVDALSFLTEQKIPVVEAITCVTPRSLEHMEETYEIVKNSGAKYWRVFNIFPSGRAALNREVLLSEDEFRILVEKMIKLQLRGKEENVVVNLSEEGWLGWEYEKQLRDTPYFCRAGINISGIMADGSISACPNLPEWMSQGNINTDSFVTVWENRYEIFRNREWLRTGICKDCNQFSVCQGNSLHIRDTEKNEPVWCHYKILHPQNKTT
ncbi:MAG: radical SAM protein [Deltaproteobacteria bacterium]|nr:radical SAM protein [Deltaproteobacteria bacterium]